MRTFGFTLYIGSSYAPFEPPCAMEGVVKNVLILTTLLQRVASQCTIPTSADLSGPGGLISNALASNGTSVANITLLNRNFVCLSTGGSRDEFSSTSVVVEYRVNDGESGSTVSQFEFGCTSNGSWVTVVSGSGDAIITSPPDASLNTTLRTDCSLCLSSQRPESTNRNVQHCEGKYKHACWGKNMCEVVFTNCV